MPGWQGSDYWARRVLQASEEKPEAAVHLAGRGLQRVERREQGSCAPLLHAQTCLEGPSRQAGMLTSVFRCFSHRISKLFAGTGCINQTVVSRDMVYICWSHRGFYRRLLNLLKVNCGPEIEVPLVLFYRQARGQILPPVLLYLVL